MHRRPGLLVSALLVIAFGLAVLPGRWVLSAHHAAFGADRSAELATGLAADAPYVLALLVVSNLLAYALLCAAVRGWPSWRLVRLSVAVTTLAAFLFVLFGTIAATELMIERGMYPTLFDLSVATDDWGYVQAALGTFVLARFLLPTALSIGLFATSALSFLKWSRLWRAGRVRHEVLPAALPLAAVGLLGFVLHRTSPWVFTGVSDWRAVESPLPMFFRSLGSSHENVRMGYITALTESDFPDGERVPGAALLGYPSEPASARAPGSSCRPHPFAVALRRSESPAPNSARARRAEQLASATEELSNALELERHERIRVWHIALESFRADDVHGLNPRAAAGVTPVVNGLYEASAQARSRVVGARAMYEAGPRSSQGLAASLCGLGTMPFGLSFARDVGLPPMRCLPDVLKDASFDLAFYYGSNLGFDNMLAFLRYHGFERMVTERELGDSAAHQAWGVSDRVLFEAALADSVARADVGAQYNFVATLTNHHPFNRPTDFPAELDERIRTLVSVAAGSIGADDVARLETMAYTDHALGEFLDALDASDAAADSIVLISADHATADTLLWREGLPVDPNERANSRSHIPFLVVLPQALVERADSDAVEAAVSTLNRHLNEGPLSQNDVPRFVLHLLSASSQIRELDPRWRWHTLGGQALSPHFAVPSHPELSVVGIDAGARVFGVTSEGVAVDLGEAVRPLTDPSELSELSTTLRPTAAWLSALLSGYMRDCWSAESIRARR